MNAVPKSFDEGYLIAMKQRDLVRAMASKIDDPKLDRKKVEEERKAKLKDVIKSLSAAMTFADNTTPVQKVDDVLYYLSGAYLTYGDPYRGAIAAESLARQRPPTRRSPEGAAVAIATYASLSQRYPEDAAIRSRLQDLCEMVLPSKGQPPWPTESVTSLAHYHTALLLKRDNKVKEAIMHLEKIAPNFTDYIYTQGQLVFMAQDARENNKDPKEQQWFTNAAQRGNHADAEVQSQGRLAVGHHDVLFRQD